MARWMCESGGHAQGRHRRSQRRRSCPSGSARRGPEQPAEARLAGEDHPGDRGRFRHGRDHAPQRQVEAERLALAGAVHDGRRGRASARQTRPSRIPPLQQTIIDRVIALTATVPPHQATHWTAAAMAEATGISVSSVAHLAGARAAAPPGALLQALHRPAVRRQAARHVGSTSIRRRMPWCSRSTRSRKFERSIGSNRGCP